MSVNSKFNGVLRVCSENPRYFSDDSGKVIFLTGSHTWATLQELKIEGQGEEANFDYDAFLNMLETNGHNFSRYWQWGYTEHACWTDEKIIFEPLVYERTGPGIACDDKLKFDLGKFNEGYFSRLRERVVMAGQRGIYVAVQFYDGTCQRYRKDWCDPWPSSPFKVENNINGVDADPDSTGNPLLFVLDYPHVVTYQKAYIRKVIDTLNDLDFVLWEIINELSSPEHFAKLNAWHEHMINYVIEYEKTKPKQHPVCKSACGSRKLNDDLFTSNAHWVTVDDNFSREYRYNPPAADGRKVIISDTDHIWGHGGSYIWAWKTFLRGMMPIFMDPWEPAPGRTMPGYPGTQLNRRDYIEWIRIRKNLGYILSYAKRLNLNRAVPRNDAAYGDYCLAWEGNQYLVYVAEDFQPRLDMSGCEGEFVVEWFDPKTGIKYDGGIVLGGIREMPFVSPFGVDAVLFVYKK